MKRVFSFVLLVVIVFSFASCSVVRNPADIDFVINAEDLGEPIKNISAVMNSWAPWDFPLDTFEPGYLKKRFPFIEYVQFMTATGGSFDRDCFIDPNNRDVLDDYDFSKLIRACKLALQQGVKPWIKTGTTPLKLSDNPKYGCFGVNMREPNDYNQYYNYIAAMAKAMLAEFGVEEISTWRWGVFTEFNNFDWFQPNEGKIFDEEICKIYDYTVHALEDILGKDIFVGSHFVNAPESFIKHCAVGVNYATGEVGTQIDYLGDSHYDLNQSIGSTTEPAETLVKNREKAKKYGLDDIVYGMDEGRILNGMDNKPLTNRIVGYSIQAPHDAIFIQSFLDYDLDYFAHWSYTSGDFDDIPTMNAHVANCFGQMVGSARVVVSSIDRDTTRTILQSFSGYNESEKSLYIMAYNYMPGGYRRYSEEKDMSFDINVPQLEGDVKITEYVINNSCNFFDEWVSDWPKFGVSMAGPESNDFDWSRDSAQPSILSQRLLDGWNSRYNDYMEYSKLVPTITEATVVNGKLKMQHTTKGQEVVFYKIETK